MSKRKTERTIVEVGAESGIALTERELNQVSGGSHLPMEQISMNYAKLDIDATVSRLSSR